MANLANVLKEEVSRIVQQEVRRQTAGTSKAAAQGQREIAALKSEIEKLRNQLASLHGPEAPKQAVSKKTGRKKAKTAPKAAEGKKEKSGKANRDADAAAAEKQALRKRFSAEALKKERERLGLSADNYGRLIGVSGLSVYNWEQKKAIPRSSSIEALLQIKGIGKRKAQKILEDLKNQGEEASGQETSGSKASGGGTSES